MKGGNLFPKTLPGFRFTTIVPTSLSEPVELGRRLQEVADRLQIDVQQPPLVVTCQPSGSQSRDSICLYGTVRSSNDIITVVVPQKTRVASIEVVGTRDHGANAIRQITTDIFSRPQPEPAAEPDPVETVSASAEEQDTAS